MRRFRLAIVLSLFAAAARAEPPIDEDALPDGAMARLGSRQRRWRDTFAHAFVDDGRTLLTVHSGPLLHYRDLATGRLLRAQRLGDVTPDAAALSTDGRVLVVDRRGTLEIWDVPAAKRIRSIVVNPNDPLGKEPYLFRLTPDGGAVLTVVGGVVHSHDVKSGAWRQAVQQAEPIHTVAVVLGGRGILIGDSERVRCLDFVSGEVQWVRKGRFDRDQMIVLPGGGFAWLPIHSPRLDPGLFDLEIGWPVEAEMKDVVRFWKCAAPDRRVACVKEGDGYSLRELAAGQVLAELPDLREPLGFASDGRSLLGRDAGNRLQRWDARTGRPIFADSGALLDVDLLAFRTDDSLVAGCTTDGMFRRWYPATQRRAKLLQMRDASFRNTLVLTADGRRLLRKEKTSDLEVWDLEEVKERLTVETPRPFGFERVALHLSADGRTLAGLFRVWDEYLTYTLRTWDAKTGQAGLTRDEPTLGGSLAFSPDASLFASAMTGTHDTATGRLRAGLPVDGLTVQRLLFSPDQSRLAAALSAGRGVVLCETATGRLVHRWPSAATGPMAFSPDGRRLITASTEAIVVWDALTGRELKRWTLTDARTNVLAVSPDGKTLASGHGDGTILLWPLPAQAAGSRVTNAERDRLWSDLADDDVGRAWLAAARLIDSPAEAIAMLRERLKPLAKPSAERVKALIGELDSPEFARRESAAKELTRDLDLIGDQLRKAAEGARSAEQLRRLRLLRDAPWTLSFSDRVRRWRTLVVLEQISSPEARKLLELIANGPAGGIESESAKAVLRRLEARR